MIDELGRVDLAWEKSMTSTPAPQPSGSPTPQASVPEWLKLFRRFTNAHFASCADEHFEGASQSGVKRRYEESNAAESAFLEEAKKMDAELTAARAALLASQAMEEELREALVKAHAQLVALHRK